MGDGRLPKVVMTRKLDRGATNGRGQLAGQWVQCVVDDVNDFGIIPITT